MLSAIVIENGYNHLNGYNHKNVIMGQYILLDLK